MYNRNAQPIKRKPIVLIEETADNFLGLGKRARARKDERVKIRNEKKRAKIEDRSYKKRVKADSLAKRYSGKAEAAIIAAKGEAANNATLAQQGIVGNPIAAPADTAGTALNAAGGVIGGIFGGNAGNVGNGDIYAPQQQIEPYYEDELQPSSLGSFRDNTVDQNGNPIAPKNNNTMFILLAAGALVVFMMMKK